MPYFFLFFRNSGKKLKSAVPLCPFSNFSQNSSPICVTMLFLLAIFLHSRSLRLCISSVWFLTQSQSATVYFFCMISFFFFLHSRSLRLCISSVRFLLLLLSSVNISLTYISDMTWPILTRLGHKYQLTTPFMSHDQIGVKGHVGVIGFKKVYSSYRLRSMITWLMYVIELETLYKSYAIRFWSKVIWGHRGQK